MTTTNVVPVFGPPETVTVAELRAGDFLIAIPAQEGVRGVTVNSGIAELSDDWNTWRQSTGYRRPKVPVRSVVIIVRDPKAKPVNRPAGFLAEVRRPQAAV
jgi:hypothetical protein